MILNHEKNIENQGDTTFTDDTVMNNKNYIIDDTGVVDEYLTEKKNDDDTINFNAVEKNENMNIDGVGIAD